MSSISGRVIVKETGLGIPDLLVVIEELGGDAERALRSSRITDRAGVFAFAMESLTDGQVKLQLTVLPPDEPLDGAAAPPVFATRTLQAAAKRDEQVLIRIPEEALARAEVPVPNDAAEDGASASQVVERMSASLRGRREIADSTRAAAVDEVTKARKQRESIDTVVKERLVESLAGVKPADAAANGIVLPGQAVGPVAWQVANDSLARNINARPAKIGYVALDEETVRQFRKADGSLRTDIAPAEIEPFLFGALDAHRRVASLTREAPDSSEESDPTELFADIDGPTPLAGPPGAAAGSASSPGEFTVDTLVRRLTEPITPPEDFGLFDQKKRPETGDVENGIQGLSLRSGPADIPAHYMFHSLQIAFDYVWQRAVDNGVLENAQILAATLAEQGGDPLKAIANASNPVTALRREVRDTAAAAAALSAAGIRVRPTKGKAGAYVNDRVHDTVGINDVREAEPAARSTHELLGDLDGLLAEKYRFDVFAPRSTNFGLLVTYDQEWVPLAYQAGSLVKTLTLTPKETRKVSVRRTVKKDRSVKELEENQRIRKDESVETMRDEAEIVQKAQCKSNFAFSAKGAYNAAVWSGEVSTSLTLDSEVSSQETKKAFREAVVKAAQEFKDERKLEVEAKESFEEESTESSEVTNPNDELTVTYLFYELQRRYRISEEISRLTPVVMVALELPNPDRSAIDKVMLTHSWIINRVLLDDRYRSALEYLRTRIVGDELKLRVQVAKLAELKAVVDNMKRLHRSAAQMVIDRDILMQNARSVHAQSVGNDDDSEVQNTKRLLKEGADADFERAVRDEKDLRLRVEAETAAFATASDAYAEAYGDHMNRTLEISALRVHFKENILYYMQAIWSFAFRDQLYFSLYDIEVPRLPAPQKTYTLSEPDEPPLNVIAAADEIVLEVRADFTFNANLDPETDKVALSEIADLDRPLGFKGNYMIFPMKQSNALTDYMMIPYLDAALGLHDPDEEGSMTPEAFARHARDLYRRRRRTLSEDGQEELRDHLRRQYRRIAERSRLKGEEITVPTNSLYIEALPGAHPLLEDFKLAHRIIDVRKAQAETRKLEMENLRYAARIIAGERNDPDVDKQVIVDSPGVIVDPEPS